MRSGVKRNIFYNSKHSDGWNRVILAYDFVIVYEAGIYTLMSRSRILRRLTLFPLMASKYIKVACSPDACFHYNCLVSVILSNLTNDRYGSFKVLA